MKKQPSVANRWADFMRSRSLEEQQRRDAVIAEFDGDARSMAAEIIRLRHGVGQLADAIGWIKDGRQFVAMPPGPYRNDRNSTDDLPAGEAL